MFSVTNALGTKYAEYAIDNFSLSPQCFGLGVPSDQVDDWRYNMTDLQFCKYYGKVFFSCCDVTFFLDMNEMKFSMKLLFVH